MSKDHFETHEAEQVNSLAVISLRQVGDCIKTEVFGHGVALKLADLMIGYARNGMKKASEMLEAETDVPESERCGENAEPASAPIG